MIVERIEQAVNLFLQRKIVFTINNKPVKSGKLMLFAVKDFYLVFTILVQNTKKIFEVPYPFGVELKENKLLLLYNLNLLHHKNTDIENNMKLLYPKKPTKYFNSIAEIVAIDE